MTVYSASYDRVCGRALQEQCKYGHDLNETRVVYGNNYGCRKCKANRTREARKNNPKRTREQNRTNHLRQNYGMESNEYNALFNAQEGRCKICGKHASELTKALAVDHVHDETQRIRGLLCGSCNVGIGLLQEDVEVLRRAIVYLSE